MKRIIKNLCIVFAAVLALCSFSLPALAAESGQSEAKALFSLGLAQGYDTTGTNFGLPDKLTRAQAAVFVVRFLGAEKDAVGGDFNLPFTDIPAWAEKYIGYAYIKGITTGTSATKYSPDESVTEAQFLTFLLRSMSYKEGASGDFVWSSPYKFANSIGMIDSESVIENFTRADAFKICWNTLSCYTKNSVKVSSKLIDSGVFTQAEYDAARAGVTDETQENLFITPISQLNILSENGDHKDDDFATASVEVDFRTKVTLSAATTGQSRYNNAQYPRIKKVRDDLYVMFYQYSQLGQHVYVSTSNDMMTWSAPTPLYNSANYKFTYPDGPLAGTETRIHFATLDAAVLDDGRILTVVSYRPVNGFGKQEYTKYSGLYARIGRVSAAGAITWDEPVSIYTGQNWEPNVVQKDNGDIQVYFSHIAPNIASLGYLDRRSSGTAYIESKDGGRTWTPNVTPDSADTLYSALRMFQVYVGDYANTKYFTAQMPSVCQLYDGSLAIAAECKSINDKYTISLAHSNADGTWKILDMYEAGPDNAQIDFTDGAAPYLVRFLSGETVLTYNSGSFGSKLHYRIGDAGAQNFGAATVAISDSGYWGSCEVLGSHEIAFVFPNITGNTKNAVCVARGYLNHRINSNKAAIAVDGESSDWTTNKDAIFVGSDSQAQATVRVAHDDDNVYLLVSRSDYYLMGTDTTTVSIATGSTSFASVAVKPSGEFDAAMYANAVRGSAIDGVSVKSKTVGTIDKNTDKDEGYVAEIAIPKSALNIADDKIKIRLSLTNNDGTTTINDVPANSSAYTTTAWPAVVLEK